MKVRTIVLVYREMGRIKQRKNIIVICNFHLILYDTVCIYKDTCTNATILY